jgi:NTP pyrophosphatase (non-canonical NTP hydrolase)
MKNLTLNQAIEKTEKLSRKFPNPKKWTSHARLADLMEEVGELANAIQTTEGYKSNKRKKSEIEDSLCDILYSIFMLASIYNVNLDEEYKKVLKDLKKRIKSGEFNQ